jgi:fructokinase
MTLVCLGESLIDFLTLGEQDGAEVFRKQPGGAPMNVACGFARLGGRASFLGKVGEDDFGRFLKRTMDDLGVDTSSLLLTDEARTGLAFVSLDDSGDRSFTFYRDPAADMLLRAEELPHKKLQGASAFHFGSISMIESPAKEATLEAIRRAKEGGALISYDPNLREALWPSLDVAAETMMSVVDQVDVMKVSDEELRFLAGSGEPGGARLLCRQGVGLVVVTKGEGGCSLYRGEEDAIDVPAPAVEVADTTGAGDAFVAAFLHRLLALGAVSVLDASREALEDAARWGVCGGALCCTGRGAIDALPTAEAVRAKLAG